MTVSSVGGEVHVFTLDNGVTHEKLDKDRFRRDLGGVEDAYAEIMGRLS